MKRQVELDGRRVTILGTSHISPESQGEVRDVVRQANPDLVAVELDETRLKSLRGEEDWRDLDVVEVLKEGKGFLLFLNVLLSIYQRKMGLEEDVTPGQEMLAALEAAEEQGVETALIDRDINETFRRALSELSFLEKLRLAALVVVASDEVDADELTDGDVVENLVLELKEEFPSLSRTFLDERNSYMAERLLERDFDHAVVVVGAAHVEGLAEDLEQGKGYEPFNERRIPWFKIMKYGLPAFIIAGLGYSFLKIGFSTGVEASAAWILINGILALLGSVAAGAHPVTWVVSFLSAPLTSLDPAIGAGMVAAYAEAKLRPPKVSDMEEFSKLESYTSLRGNRVGVVLLTFVLVSLGSAAATFISAGYIASLISLA